MPEVRKFTEDISIIEGPPVRALGIPFPTRMIIVKLSAGSLWLNSPVFVSGDLLDRVKELGPVKYLVAPTKLHIWRLERWHALFPEAELWMPPNNPRKPKWSRRASVLGGTVSPDWVSDLDQLVFKGNLFIQEVFFLHKRSRTLIVGDFIQNHPIETGKSMLNTLWRIGGVAYPQGGVPLDIRLSFTDRNIARQCLEKLLSWEFDKLIIAHGVCVEKNARGFVEQAFRWLAH